MGKILTQNNSKDNYVAQTLRRGYLIGDRLLRSAYVTIYSSEG